MPPGARWSRAYALTREIVRDVTKGVVDTGVRARLIGEKLA